MEKMKTSKFTFFCHEETVIVIKIILHIHRYTFEGGWRIDVTGTERGVIAEIMLWRCGKREKVNRRRIEQKIILI